MILNGITLASDEPEKSSSVQSALKRIKARAAKAAAASDHEASNKPGQMFFPGFDIGAMPNHINRSSMFAPIARGRRKFHRQTELVTRGNVTMHYTGEQLDEADADLTMALISLTKNRSIGQPVTVNLAALLRSMQRSTGKHDYQWLYRRMKALTEATLFIETRKPDGSPKYRLGHSEAFHIVQAFRFDAEADCYTFTLDPRWEILFRNREYALLDWQKRMKIGRGQDMAKALQRLIATSKDTIQRYRLDWLKLKFAYGGRMRDFKGSLKNALGELESLGIVVRGRIETNTRGQEQLTIWTSKELSG